MAAPVDASTARRADTSFAWALLESGGMALLSLLTLMILARLVGPHDLGLAALALGLVQLLTLVVEMLMHDVMVQRPRLDDIDIDTAFWTSIAGGLGLFAVCLLAAPPFAAIFTEPGLVAVVMVTGISLIFSSASGVPMALLRREQKFRALAMRSLWGRVAGAVLGIAVAFAGGGVWSVVAQQLSHVAISAVLIWPAVTWRPSLAFSRRSLAELLAFGLPSIGGRIMWVLAQRLFTVVYGYTFGVTSAGYLNIAQRVVDTLYDTLGGAAYNVALPYLSRQQSDLRAFSESCRSGVELTAVTTLPIFGGLAICAPAMITVLLGAEWQPVAPLIAILALGAMVQFLFLLPNVALVAAGRPGDVLVLSLVSFFFVFAAWAVLGPLSPMIAVMVWASRGLATAPLALFFVWRLFHRSCGGLIRGSLMPVVAVSLMAAALTLVERTALTDAGAPLVLAVTVPLGMVLYATLIGVLNRALFARIAQQIIETIRLKSTA